MLLFWGQMLLGQASQDSVALKIDTISVVERRPCLEDLTQKYSGKEFDYSIKTGESQNLLARFFNWLNRWLADTFGINISPEAFNIIKWLIYILMSGLIIYLIVRLLLKERFETLFTKRSRSLPDVKLGEKHIDEIDFDMLLSKAIKENDYRLAIRYHFLKLLKRLSQKEIITWHFEKTNSDYQNEIKEVQIQSGFKNLAYLYDYVWYGEQPIDQLGYQEAQNQFEAMNQLIPN